MIYYQDEHITLYHGDCREIAPTLGRFDLLLTDPPYGLGNKLHGGSWGTNAETWDGTAPDMNILLLTADKACIWGGNYFELPLSRGWLVWIKPDANGTIGKAELAWTSEDRIIHYLPHTIAATNAERNGHPTLKPMRVMTWSLSFFPEARTILDPFAGSGTTGRAAKDLGLHCTMIEREERYCEIAAKRMAQEVLF
jgi:DNA modification methylase